MQAIEPLYPDKAREFSYLESGYMLRVIEERTAAQGIACSPIFGTPDMGLLKSLFDLDDSHMPALTVALGGSLRFEPLPAPTRDPRV